METSISVITPSVRPEGLKVIRKCLSRQDFTDFEWVVVMPEELWPQLKVSPNVLLTDPPKREGDFWSLCKAWNLAYSQANGQLVVNIQDWVWMPPNTLSAFWSHFVASPRAIVTAIGNQYEKFDERGEPENIVWQDPRKRDDQGSFYKCEHSDVEMTVCSIPKQALVDCGGIDEEYDKGPGLQEKEMILRMMVLGYEPYIDQSIEYKALYHPRLTSDWDQKYKDITQPLYKRHVAELLKAERTLNVDSLRRYNK